MTLGAVPPPGMVALIANLKTVLDGMYNNTHLYEGSLRRLVWVLFHQHVSRVFNYEVTCTCAAALSVLCC